MSNVAETSMAAFATVDTNKSEARVLSALLDHGPMIRERIAEVTGMKECSVCGSVFGLLKKGLVAETGETSKTRSGKAAKVVFA